MPTGGTELALHILLPIVDLVVVIAVTTAAATIYLREKIMSAAQDTVDNITAAINNAVTNINQSVATAQTNIGAAIQGLRDQVAAGGAPDLTHLQAAADSLGPVQEQVAALNNLANPPQ